MDELSWSFGSIWNEVLGATEQREIQPRDHLWASELGSSFIDRWYKMKGVRPSNPFDNRALRKFEAGKLFEWVAETVLLRAGILTKKQQRIEFQYPGLPKVVGYLDYVAGGTPDWEKAKASLTTSEFPDFVTKTAQKIIEVFSQRFPLSLREIVLEIKSVGSQKFHYHQDHHVIDPSHELQLFHYLKGKNMSEGHLVYLSKDDLCMSEIGVFYPSITEEKYKNDIQKMKEAYNRDKPPEKEKPIEFNEAEYKFRYNWKVPYSSYLTLIYGYKDQAEFDKLFRPRVAKWNRLLSRLVGKKKLTDDNKETIKEIKKDFPNFDKIVSEVQLAKEKGKVNEEELEDENTR